MRAIINEIPSQGLMGLLTTQDGQELYFDRSCYEVLYKPIRVGDTVFIQKIQSLVKSVQRPIEILKLSPEDIIRINKKEVKDKMNMSFKKEPNE
jgi:hypothetical protein